LGQLFPDSEAPTTKKRAALPAEEVLCPVCGGSGSVHLSPYAARACPLCAGSRLVSRDVFDKYIAEHPESVAARQFKKT
jgi:hypothetical protein